MDLLLTTAKAFVFINQERKLGDRDDQMSVLTILPTRDRLLFFNAIGTLRVKVFGFWGVARLKLKGDGRAPPGVEPAA